MPVHANTARVVLDDCRSALAHLRNNPSPDKWRLYWVATVALLRTVEEALKHVDGRRRSPAAAKPMQRAVAAFLEELESGKPEPMIYWGLIHVEANNILHQYKFTAGKIVVLGPPGLANGVQAPYSFHSGPFEGRDQRDVVQEATDWWQVQIEKIEQRAREIEQQAAPGG
jgi:hypothetical protein